MRQFDRDGGRQGCLAYTTLAHQHDQPVSIRRDAVDQLGHAGLVEFDRGINRCGCLWRKVGQQLPQCFKADEIEGLKFYVITRKRSQRSRDVLQRRLFPFVDCSGEWVGSGFNVRQDAVDDEMLLFEAYGGQFFVGARHFAQSGLLGASDQHQAGLQRISQGFNSRLVLSTLLFQTGQRA